jgi:hypothetical protein
MQHFFLLDRLSVSSALLMLTLASFGRGSQEHNRFLFWSRLANTGYNRESLTVPLVAARSEFYIATGRFFCAGGLDQALG